MLQQKCLRMDRPSEEAALTAKYCDETDNALRIRSRAAYCEPNPGIRSELPSWAASDAEFGFAGDIRDHDVEGTGCCVVGRARR